ncbi:IS1182 family transposase [Aneurinibacillus sp. Ricciae_BoGa-3]|uniref:IS1182 family transposase n=1 Tax=Aneurinibacillus sp. Ricciae_BoGa-3 TaxID=3022697 RepID=UPI00234081E3|nr:IS1182 family transposase [Aneurinibacillus sp. Ricciae_BoGa-3]WCK56498.1 IS1182 family transposase [Aneurinibacillus sp. Ricciae_BoGa-3]
MSNQMITNKNYTTQTTLPLAVKEENIIVSKRQYAPTFKPYNNRQVQVIFDIEELIPENHVARVVDEMVETIPDEHLFSHYPGGGRRPFHPKMMLKVILFGYSQKVYSCRGIQKLTEENLPTMWLAAMQRPDYRTINDFRGQRMKPMMDQLFQTMILKLIEDNHITMENYFLDGTKIEDNANKYSFEWKKATVRSEEKLRQKIQETLRHIEEMTKAEELEIFNESLQDIGTAPSGLEQIAARLETHVSALSGEIEEETDTQVRKEKRKKRSGWKKPFKLIREDFLPRLAKYNVQNETFGDRNSYSKIDTDATFMRMKEDHMKNGQLKPGYNVQMATENQFILFYTIHQRPTDTRCFIPHLEKLTSSSLPMPKTVIADAGYGSEENYLYAIGEEKEPRFDFLIPYGTYLKEKTRKAKKDIKNVMNWSYDEKDDCFICPNNRKVVFKKYQIRKNASGHEQSYKIYECEDCTDCPLKPQCTKAKGNRQVHWNTVFEEMKAKAKAALECEDKAAIYARRKVEVESVFGHIKGNRSFRRFSLRGLDKVNVEFGIVALAHNLLKVASIRLATFLDPIRTKKKLAKKENFSPASLLFQGLFRQPLLTLALTTLSMFT